MKKMRRITDELDVFEEDLSMPIKRIEKTPLPYTGNKKKLLYYIHKALTKNGVEFNTVLDAFTGSASVSLLFKVMGKKIIANDILTSSYLNAVAFVENPGLRLSEEDKDFLLNHQNENKGTFVEDHYRSDGKVGRFNKFTLKECQELDNFRANVDELCDFYMQSLGMTANAAVVMRLPFGNVDASTDPLTHRIKQQESYGKESGQHDRRIGIYYDDEYNLLFDKWFRKYVDDFAQDKPIEIYEPKIKRATFLANLQQHVLRDCMVQGRMHQGQALAEVKVRMAHQKNQLKASWDNQGSTEMDFHTRAGTGETDCKPGQGIRWWSFADLELPGNCLATNMDVVDLLESGLQVDCAYFDPPYGGQSSDYSTIYRFFEEYIYSKPLEELPHLARAKDFVGKKRYEEHFIRVLEAANHIPIWLFSYNDSSWRDIDDIVDIIKQFKNDVTVEVLADQYRYLYRKNQGRTNKSSEYLIIAR